MTFLEDLPKDHPYRNKPLLGAFYKWKGFQKTWKEVMPTFPIAKNTYNQLSICWTEHDNWTFDNPYKNQQ